MDRFGPITADDRPFYRDWRAQCARLISHDAARQVRSVLNAGAAIAHGKFANN